MTRYDDVLQVLRDDRFAKDRAAASAPGQRDGAPWMPGFIRPLTRNMLDLDGADHARLRTLVQ